MTSIIIDTNPAQLALFHTNSHDKLTREFHRYITSPIKVSFQSRYTESIAIKLVKVTVYRQSKRHPVQAEYSINRVLRSIRNGDAGPCFSHVASIRSFLRPLARLHKRRDNRDFISSTFPPAANEMPEKSRREKFTSKSAARAREISFSPR